jgi:diguanylate cyclase (GGDEF)-like protein
VRIGFCHSVIQNVPCIGIIVIDYNSLLIALSFCSMGLAFTFFVSWSVSRADRVLVSWGIGVSFLVASLFVYRDFVENFSPVMGTVAFSALLLGLTFFMGAGRQFRTGKLPVPMMVIAAVVSIAAMAIPMLLGYDGISYIALNIGSAILMSMTGWDYLRYRAEAPTLIMLLSTLYILTALSFVLCAVVLVHDANWVMNHAPTGWAENVNLTMCLTSIGGMGALSLGLNQVRLTRLHKREAETDALTGLFNRRAVFDRTQRLSGPLAVIIFDIDHFKRVNDVHGHQAGDTVLQMFSRILSANIRDGDLAARLGGEEFSVVLSDATPQAAMHVAERVRESFAAQRFISAAGDFTSTVSAGIAYATQGKPDLTLLLSEADIALYEAKRVGRNQVLLYSEGANLVPSNGPAPAMDRDIDNVVKLWNRTE